MSISRAKVSQLIVLLEPTACVALGKEPVGARLRRAHLAGRTCRQPRVGDIIVEVHRAFRHYAYTIGDFDNSRDTEVRAGGTITQVLVRVDCLTRTRTYRM